QGFQGGEGPRTAAQRSLRRNTSGRERKRETPVNAVRQWLATQPQSPTKKDYDDYATQHNSGVIEGRYAGLLLGRSQSVLVTLNLEWQQALELAKEESDYDELRIKYEEQHLADAGALDVIAGSFVASILAQSPSQLTETSAKVGFPT